MSCRGETAVEEGRRPREQQRAAVAVVADGIRVANSRPHVDACVSLALVDLLAQHVTELRAGFVYYALRPRSLSTGTLHCRRNEVRERLAEHLELGDRQRVQREDVSNDLHRNHVVLSGLARPHY